MKELTIEQKAKAYDEAVKVIKDNLDALNEITETGSNVVNIQSIRNCFYRAFPELKESEDERIRKAILHHLMKMWGNSQDDICGVNVEDAIAWLEKQDIFSKKDIDDAYLKGVRDTKNEIEKQYEANYQIRKDIATFIFNYKGNIKDRAKWMNYLGIKVSFVEKQGEQKPAWSEEDEHRVKDTVYFLDTAKKHYASVIELDACIDWLKSLKDRVGCEANCTTKWKPSEEQMKALAEALSLAKNCGEERAFDLRTLHEQLEKL